MSFDNLNLSPKVLSAVEAAGYQTPTPIQEQAIPIAVSGRDVLGIAQTGTGKTASFVLPMLTRLEKGRARARMPRSLILAPTRELAAQVAASFEQYGTNHRLTLALLIGGVSFVEQFQKLDRGVDVLIATPGRLLDHFGRGKLLLTGVEVLVIDEADRMLDMGFIPDIERICKLLPPRRQTLLFSATMPPEIQRLVKNFLRDPERIEVAPPTTAPVTIVQRFCFTSNDPRLKRAALRDLIRSEDVKNAIIFCNRKRDVAILHKSLLKHGFNVGALHGDLDQYQRTATLDAFRAGEITLLAASDVAARGLDIPEVSHVFNFDAPLQAEDYVHRIGRTGRAGLEGHSATLITTDDVKFLRAIESRFDEDLVWIGEPPGEEDLAASGRRRRGGRRTKQASDARRASPRAEKNDTSRRAASSSAPEQKASPDDAEAAETAPARADTKPRRGKPERRRGEREKPRKREEAVVGLGDHVPAFLLRPVSVDR